MCNQKGVHHISRFTEVQSNETSHAIPPRMSLVQPKDEDGGKALSPYDNYVVGKSRKIITTLIFCSE